MNEQSSKSVGMAALVSALHDENWQVRNAAVDALGQIAQAADVS